MSLEDTLQFAVVFQIVDDADDVETFQFFRARAKRNTSRVVIVH